MGPTSAVTTSDLTERFHAPSSICRTLRVAASVDKIEQRSGINHLLVMWHVLSLDAPTVAVVWTSFTAFLSGTPLSLSFRLAVSFAVWILYAADRLMDTRSFTTESPLSSGDFELRHHFHYQHRVVFLGTILFAIGTLTMLLPSIPKPALHLYLIEAAFVAAYFVFVHGSFTRHFEIFRRLPKEILVGPFFAAAMFIPTISRHPELPWRMLPNVLLFAGLCCLNCFYIYG